MSRVISIADDSAVTPVERVHWSTFFSSSKKDKEEGVEEEEEGEEDDEEKEEEGKKGRSKNWSWGDTFQMIRVVKEKGKNWGAVLDEMKNVLHRIDWITEPDKVRRHYNTVNNKKNKLWKAYKTPKLRIKSAWSKERQMKEEAEHARKHEMIRKEREVAQSYLREVEEREHLHIIPPPNQPQEDEIRAEMQRKGEERRKTRDERLQTSQHFANNEMKYRERLITTLEGLVKGIVRMGETDAELMEMIKEERAAKKARTEEPT